MSSDTLPIRFSCHISPPLMQVQILVVIGSFSGALGTSGNLQVPDSTLAFVCLIFRFKTGSSLADVNFKLELVLTVAVT